MDLPSRISAFAIYSLTEAAAHTPFALFSNTADNAAVHFTRRFFKGFIICSVPASITA